MTRRLLILALICLLPTAALARLGETHAQCDARYGPKWKAGVAMPWSSDVRVYEKNGVRIEVTFIGGIAGHIRFHKNSAPDLDAKQAQAIMDMNGNGREWKVISKDQKSVTLACFDASVPVAGATYSTGGTLDLMSAAFTSAANATLREQSAKTVAGF